MFAGNPAVHAHAADRLQGLHVGAGLGWEVEVFDTASVEIRSGVAVGAEIARRRPAARPDGLFCANDLVAVGAL